ncbi:tyrosine-type recombinase/integrase [Robertmurraya kyonggiensis]|uniref:Uncharacterized protein n=1 Tax=Robertmurraya kyonggiensis TaxID=1037680 RepID=A0A4V5P0N0_9BACI|nr:tyrosine-type recombinase/integrase [Robertmurraya kyonggiensis]TKC14366.1 hypothetical protein FA727_21640 [Robertmurraya kyonggiensis]
MELIRNIDSRGISKVYVKEKVFFNENDLEKYIDIFEELKDDGFIIASSYEDIKWRLPCTSTNQYIPLKFDIDMYKEIKQALKIYSLILIAKGKSASWVRNIIEILKKAVLVTNGLKQTLQLDNFLHSENRSYFAARAVLGFTDFYFIPNANEIRTICEAVQSEERRNRELPPFLDIFIFDEIVNDFFRKASTGELLRYKAIQLWWAITNIIPMRPTDFLKLKSNCVWNDDNGRYWITLSRSKKVKQSVRDTPPLQTIQINKDIFNLVNNFKLHLFQIGIKSDYLLPQSLYQIINWGKGRKKNVVEDRWSIEQFSSLLKHFHQKIIKDLYQEDYTMELLPSHTRHLAITNLFLQGFNMLSIAKMAGHDELNSQSNYYSHAENFIDSYVYTLVKSGLSNRIGSKMGDGFIGWRRETIDKGKRYSYEEAKEQFLNAKYGFCKDKDNFPINCGKDCRPCSFYIFKPSINEYDKGIKWLEMYSEDIGTEIKNVVQIMISTSKALSSSYRPDLDESLKSRSHQLQQLMDHKSMVEYKLLEDHFNE